MEIIGQTYYQFRAALMVRNNEGLTKTYNPFHDPDQRDPEITKLRELHAAMDRAWGNRNRGSFRLAARKGFNQPT